MVTKTFTLPSVQEKPEYVRQLFSRLAACYDLMNDLMTFGLHRLWKKQACRRLELKPGDRVLDVCCGTGDLTLYLAKLYPDLEITGLDFCEDMLNIARQRLSKGKREATFVRGDAMALPFDSNCFEGVIISYGLRNVANYRQCLSELHRVLKPGGRVVVLDMSYPNPLMNFLSGFYRFSLLPLLGKWVTQDPEAYRYLSTSIYFYLPQQDLAALMRDLDFAQVTFENRLGGICAMHSGIKSYGQNVTPSK